MFLSITSAFESALCDTSDHICLRQCSGLEYVTPNGSWQQVSVRGWLPVFFVLPLFIGGSIKWQKIFAHVVLSFFTVGSWRAEDLFCLTAF